MRRPAGVAPEHHAVMQAPPERPVGPEFHLDRADAVAGPVRRARHAAERLIRRRLGHRRLQREAPLQRAGLLAGPGAYLRQARAGGEIGVGLRRAHLLHRPARPDLAAQRFPVEHHGRLGLAGKLHALGASSELVKNTKPRSSRAFSSTMRASGRPSASTVASAMAVGSFGSAPSLQQTIPRTAGASFNRMRPALLL